MAANIITTDRNNDIIRYNYQECEFQCQLIGFPNSVNKSIIYLVYLVSSDSDSPHRQTARTRQSRAATDKNRLLAKQETPPTNSEYRPSRSRHRRKALTGETGDATDKQRVPDKQETPTNRVYRQSRRHYRQTAQQTPTHSTY